MDSSVPDWSTLPRDLLAIIGNHILLRHSLVEILRFRAVCHSFRSSAPSPPKPSNPNFRILFTKPSTPGHGRTFLLNESTIYSIQPLQPISNNHETTPTWLLKLQHSNFGKVRIKNPPDNSPKSLNLLDYRVKEITKICSLELSYKYTKTIPTVIFDRAAVSADRSEIMAIHCTGRKAFLWMNGNEKWTEIDPYNNYFKDLVYYNEKFYVLDDKGMTIEVDCKSLSIASIAKPCDSFDYMRRDWKWNLVKSVKDLFLIVTYSKWVDSNVGLKIYKVDEEKLEWVQVGMDEFEDTVLFVGDDCSFSLSTEELYGYKGNRVYFFHDFMDKFDLPERNNEFGDLKDGILRPDFDEEYSKLFWPPPTWLQLGSSRHS